MGECLVVAAVSVVRNLGERGRWNVAEAEDVRSRGDGDRCGEREREREREEEEEGGREGGDEKGRESGRERTGARATHRCDLPS